MLMSDVEKAATLDAPVSWMQLALLTILIEQERGLFSISEDENDEEDMVTLNGMIDIHNDYFNDMVKRGWISVDKHGFVTVLNAGGVASVELRNLLSRGRDEGERHVVGMWKLWEEVLIRSLKDDGVSAAVIEKAQLIANTYVGLADKQEPSQ